MCVRGFPDMPVFEVGGHARSDTVITSLIPHMNFTYNATIVGFLVAGRGLSREPYSKIQVWRQNSSQVGVYYKVEPDINIVNIDIVCVSSIRVVANVRSCILNDEYQVSVQPGDILGLELPQTNQDEFFFVSGGPKNYIFEHEMTSPIKLNDSNYMRVQQPQIAFNLTSGSLLDS